VGTETPSYRGFRYPVEIISRGVWLYYRFPLSFREVEEMMLQRGIVVSHETIRPMVRQVRADLRQRAASPPAPPRRYVAPRRGISHDQRSAAVPVACG
jgi:transposase-like protein